VRLLLFGRHITLSLGILNISVCFIGFKRDLLFGQLTVIYFGGQFEALGSKELN